MSVPFELIQRLGVHGPFDRLLGRRPGASGTAAYGFIDQLRGRPTGAAIETLGAAARAVRRAEHPGLQRVIGAGRVDGSAYVMTELVAGESLALLVARGRSAGWPTVPAHVAADLVAELASIAGALHQVGHTHGRLDPENVLISYRGTVRLMNTVSAAVDARLEGEKLSPADDVHALGELFEFLLRGGGLSLGTIDMGPYEPVIAQALALDPAQRPADGATFARALRQAGSPSPSTATLAGWVRDCCPDRAGTWRDILKALRGEPTPRTFKRLARLLAPAHTDAPASAQAPSFAPQPVEPQAIPPRASTGPLPAPTSTGPLPVLGSGEQSEILVPPRVLKPLPDPGEDEPTTEVRSPSSLEIKAIKPAIDLSLTAPDPTPPDPATDSHEATTVFAAPEASPQPEGESTSEALFPIAAVTPAPIFTALSDVPPDGYEPELYVDAPPPLAPVLPSLDPLLDPTAGRPAGNLHSAWVVELSRIINGVCVESRIVHAGQRHPWIRNARDRVQLKPPKGATGHWRHLGEQHPLTEEPTALEPGDRAELHHQGARWSIRVDHAASAPGGATGRRKPWGLWLTAIAAGLGLHIIFAAGVVSLDAIGVRLTVDEPQQKERWASLAEDKPLPDAPKPEAKPKPRPKPRPKPKPTASKPLPPADPAEARPTMPSKVRQRVRNRINTARRRAKDDAEALLNAVAANPDAPGRTGATLKDVVSTIDAVGKAGATAALEVGGTLGTLPGGSINIGRERARLSPGGGKQIGASVGRIGKRRSKGNGKVRGKVRNLSSRTKVAQCSVSKGAVRAAIERKQGRIVGCYESALLRKDTLSGKITIEWRLGTTGRPTGAKVKVSTLGDPKVAQCVLGVIRKTKFPAPKTGECIISYPFIFSPSR